MQEIYTNIVNNGVTLVIVAIFLYQYILNMKKPETKEDHETTDTNKELTNDNFMLSIINRLDKIIDLLQKNLK